MYNYNNIPIYSRIETLCILHRLGCRSINTKRIISTYILFVFVKYHRHFYYMLRINRSVILYGIFVTGPNNGRNIGPLSYRNLKKFFIFTLYTIFAALRRRRLWVLKIDGARELIHIYAYNSTRRCRRIL